MGKRKRIKHWLAVTLERLSKAAIIIVDLAILNGAVFLSFGFRYLTDPDFNAAVNIPPYLAIIAYINLAALMFMDMFGVQKYYRKTFYEMAVSCVQLVALLFAVTVVLAFFVRGFSYPRAVLLMTPVIQLLVLLPWKGFCVRWWNRNHPGIVLIVGNETECEKVAEKVKHANPDWGMETHFKLPPDEVILYPQTLRKVRDVIICPSVQDSQRVLIMDRCIHDSKVVYVVPELSEITMIGARQVTIEDLLTFMVDRFHLTFEQRLVKRVFDIIFSLLGLLLTGPFLLFIGLLIRLDSPGAALYRQERVTRNGKIFRIFKFRTMREDAEAQTGPVLAEENDPRLTRFGRWVRRHRIDEFPQLINVLRGEMSLVGPRSERPYFVQQFNEDIPQYRYRTSVKAGITGYAQVAGGYDTLPEDKLRYDLLYIKNYSLLLDIKILLQTVTVVLRGHEHL